ncbi:hydantoinase B/oxoprolinase family protein [Rhodovibrio salinarum]|uniref:5-oxoprolinase n=1 Tax=Rhodovibrio salinarum TaxID=1087 RepID=A0A934QH72_9PROT|nr:hydantoinase B/oxoprolinase family protein [Rhodovibrio salinarum]MBK1696485.1 5-oxoprolinase [Rhodovibrio salinarum]
MASRSERAGTLPGQESERSAAGGRWQFWVDRGGTFTDVVARTPAGDLKTHKLLSDNPEQYDDAALQGVRDFLGLKAGEAIPADQIEAVKMGTTVATNALLERKGEATALAITKGFRDQLRIAYQNRPQLFTMRIDLPELLYGEVVEIDARVTAEGEELKAPDSDAIRRDLQAVYDKGIRALAVACLHGYRYPEHERTVAEIAREIGFTQVSTSHQVSPLMKLVSRGDTTVVDAYLSPILRRYVDKVAGELGDVQLMFMQSNGGLTDAHFFQGKDAILSGPAGGIVGAARTAAMAGIDKLISFDMGGTSTDVAHYDGAYERAFETQVAGVRMRAPMMQIHTVAAGGGSILQFDGTRYRVGPDSAGANPGPACYRRGGPLTVTDANLMLGRIQPAFFPKVFGPNADQPLDGDAVQTQFRELAERISRETGDKRAPEEVADGFRRIAVENMANAIKKISIQQGHDVTGYTLNCFGGAGGQHACDIADTLGMTRIFLHPFAGVLSAYGMGLADLRVMREQAVEKGFSADVLPEVEATLEEIGADGRQEMQRQGVAENRVETVRRVHLRYDGTDSALVVDYGRHDELVARFEAAHKQRFGFVLPDKPLIVEAVSTEVIGHTDQAEDPVVTPDKSVEPLAPVETVRLYTHGQWHDTPVYDRADLLPGETIDGPAIVIEPNSTTTIEPGWRAELTERNHLVLNRVEAKSREHAVGTQVDPVMLEVFNNLFMSVAEQMGSTLENTAYSVNIKERLDFSCAVFDPEGNLVANAPHMPVHLGSMGESVRTVIRENAGKLRKGDVYMLNDPYNGGTHLPDITVITPVFDQAGETILFYVASRGHHADVGGITPGSMPPNSTRVEEEGVLIDNFKLVDQGEFREQALRELLESGDYPVRNVTQNIGDLQAQIAANEKGVREIGRMVETFGLEVVHAYMGHVQDNAEEQVRRVLDALKDGSFTYPLDNGSEVSVDVTIDKKARTAKIDFSRTSAQRPDNFNAPKAVARAAVLYVFRTLVADDIPMNEGCLKPLEIVIPEGSMLNPKYPGAVVAGNVEVSQTITDTLYGATGVMAAAQGTMNNFTFGNDRYQYYETICGGSGAGPDFDGTSAVHTHMTNSRLTDPEVLEWRFPVLLEDFHIRRGSGGKGKHVGGDGTHRRLQFREAMTAAILSNHRKVAPFGLDGGEPGALGRNWVERKDGAVEDLSGTDRVEMAEGDVFVIETPGGGGYGKT